MSEENKTEKQLRTELSFLRQRVAELEDSLAAHQQGEERCHQLCARFPHKESIDGSAVLIMNGGFEERKSAFLEMVGCSADSHELDRIPHSIRNLLEAMAVQIDLSNGRAKAGDELRESENKYRELVDFLPISVFELDLEGNMVSANRATFETFGYHPEEVEQGINALSLGIVAEDRDRVRENILKRLRGEAVGNAEYTAVRKDGSTFPIQILAAMIHRGSEPVGFRGVLIDNTERKKAEEALRRKTALLEAQLNTSIEGILIVDGNNRRILMNRRLIDLWNVPRHVLDDEDDAALLNHVVNLVKNPVEFRERVMDLYHHPYQIRSEEIEFKNGMILDRYTAPVLDEHGNHYGRIWTFRDVTERRQAEEELISKNKQLMEIIEFLPDATLVVDREGRVIAWNRAIETLTGIEAEEMLGKGDYEYALPFYGTRRPLLVDLALHPGKKEAEKHYVAIQRVGEILSAEAMALSGAAGDVNLHATASVLRDSRGEVFAGIECIRDNTAWKRIQERLSRAEKMEGLGRLAGGVAHDLNNVLGILVGYSELLGEMVPAESPLKAFAKNILQSSLRGAAIVQDLLTLARRGVNVSEVVNLNQVVADYLETPEFEKLEFYHSQVKISADLEENLLDIKGSPIHLSKTLMNLVSNAAEAVSGPGEVTIRTENRYLDVPIRGYDSIQEGDYAVLTVSDTGSGISAEDLDKIFEPFYTKKVMGRSGTGLGLAVVWGTVKDHNGYIDVRSAEGKGTTITVYFPVTREERGEVRTAIPLESYAGRGESVLVVDDMPEQRELALGMLSRLGYQGTAVSSGEAAVDYLRFNRVDLVVLDMIMGPGMDGLETYQRILEINPVQKAIIASGFSRTERVKRAQELGAGAYVRKPYLLENLGLAVRRELDRAMAVSDKR